MLARFSGWSRAEIDELPFAELKAHIALIHQLTKPP